VAQRKRKSHSRVAEQSTFFGDANADLPPFASTPEEIRRAVERNAIERGVLLMRVLVSLELDGLLDTIEQLAVESDREEIYESAAQLGIDVDALAILDNARPPISYPFYFCTSTYLVQHPQLVMYYRNVAMLSRKVMNGTQYPTRAAPRAERRDLPSWRI
jgi:hypothetical protein